MYGWCCLIDRKTSLLIVPDKISSYLREAYYSVTLEQCHNKGYIGFETFIDHPEVQLDEDSI